MFCNQQRFRIVNKNAGLFSRIVPYLAVWSGAFMVSLVSAQEQSSTDSRGLIRQIETSSTKIMISFADQKLAAVLAQFPPDQLNKNVQLWIAGVDPSGVPPVAGEVTLNKKQELIYKPRFPLKQGKSYTLVIRGFGTDVKRTIKIPANDTPISRIQAIHPSAPTLPENNLKFYLQFTAPMQKGNVYQYVQLREVGKPQPIELPFLELEQELWSRDSLRLTLLLDPGRIKRGLKPRVEVGPIFQSGRRYELVISGRWPDHLGRPLGNDVLKRFHVGGYDESRPDPQQWQIKRPLRGTQDPLTIEFREPLDHSMLARVVRIADSTGTGVEGKVTIQNAERRWMFKPSASWRAGKYTIVVDDTLEDLAGNSIEKLFDVDVFEEQRKSSNAGRTKLHFEIM